MAIGITFIFNRWCLLLWDDGSSSKVGNSTAKVATIFTIPGGGYFFFFATYDMGWPPFFWPSRAGQGVATQSDSNSIQSEKLRTLQLQPQPHSLHSWGFFVFLNFSSCQSRFRIIRCRLGHHENCPHSLSPENFGALSVRPSFCQVSFTVREVSGIEKQ